MSDLLFVPVVAIALLALLARQITSTRSSGWLWSVLFLSALHAWTIVVRPIVNRYDPTGAAKSCGVPPDGWDAVHSSRNNYGGNFGCPADAVSALVAKHAATGVAQSRRPARRIILMGSIHNPASGPALDHTQYSYYSKVLSTNSYRQCHSSCQWNQ